MGFYFEYDFYFFYYIYLIKDVFSEMERDNTFKNNKIHKYSNECKIWVFTLNTIFIFFIIYI